MVNWDVSPAVNSVDISGYLLYMDDGFNGNFIQIYSGRG
jgi:hypothetical protein